MMVAWDDAVSGAALNTFSNNTPRRARMSTCGLMQDRDP
jgi:hypothetical protein